MGSDDGRDQDLRRRFSEEAPDQQLRRADLIPVKWHTPDRACPEEDRKGQKHHKPEMLVAKLRQAEALTGQGRSAADAVRSIGASELTIPGDGRSVAS